MLLEERVGQATTEAEAARLALDVYGLEVTAKSLPGEYDDNFQLTAVEKAPSPGFSQDAAAPRPTGCAFVLKVMHPAREHSLIDLQCRALQHLAERTPQLDLPRVGLTKSGESFTTTISTDGSSRLVWLLSYVPGTVMAQAKPHSGELLASLGTLLGEMAGGLADFSHPAAQRDLKWDFARAGWIRDHLDLIADTERRTVVEKFLALYDAEVVPVMGRLRRSVVYGDANDYNVLVGEPWPVPRRVISVIDFGDMHETFTVSEVAIAAAYAILGKKEPLRAASAVVSGYHQAFPLTELETGVLYALIGTRLAVSVINSAQRSAVKPDDSYVTISERPASAFRALHLSGSLPVATGSEDWRGAEVAYGACAFGGFPAGCESTHGAESGF
jgi:Ser/Thr protein kinase RdoA (MazF antagonist)